MEDTPIDHGKDWSISDDPDTERERAAPGNRNHNHRGLGSDYRAQEQGTAAARREKINHHVRMGSSRDRNRGYASGEIHRMTVALALPEHVGKRAKRIFRDLHADTSLEGVSLDDIAAACLYAACRMHGMGRSPAEIETYARATERMIQRRLWWVAEKLNLEVPPPDVSARIRYIGGQLPGGSQAVQQAVSHYRELDGTNTSSGSPTTLAAALLYMAGEWTQTEIAETAGCSPVGLRNRRDGLN